MMQRVFCFASLLAVTSCALTHDSGSVANAPSHLVLNVHLREPNDAAMTNGLVEWTTSSEHLFDALEDRVGAFEAALGNHMSAANAQIHELVSIGSSWMQQLRRHGQEERFLAFPSDGSKREIHSLKEQLGSVTHDALASDEGAHAGDDSAVVEFDALSSEAAAREKLMNAQRNFASVGDMVESDDQKAIESKLALAMKSPSHIDHPAISRSSNDVVRPCHLDAHVCPNAWSNAGGTCAASADYAGPCARELTLSGMSEEQLRAIAKYCRLELACQ